jgi:hypothetical protein
MEEITNVKVNVRGYDYTIERVYYNPIFGIVAIIEDLGTVIIWVDHMAKYHINDGKDKLVDRVKEFIYGH